MEQFIYKGSYEQVKQQIYTDYKNDDVELCSFFSAAAPDLTIDEVVKLFAELRHEIDGDTVLHFAEGTATNLYSELVVSSGEVLNLLNEATVNCLITYPEADCDPDMLAFSVPGHLSHQDVIRLFAKTVSANAAKRSTDRLARLDWIIDEMKHLYGCDFHGIHVHCCAEIKE